METNPTQEPTFKLLKITNHNGSVNYIPLNRQNLTYHEQKKNALSAQKKEKYKIEEVTLTLDEAIEKGISEAIQYKYPPKKRSQQNSGGSDELVKLLAAQIEANNKKDEMIAKLASRLDALETKKTK